MQLHQWCNKLFEVLFSAGFLKRDKALAPHHGIDPLPSFCAQLGPGRGCFVGGQGAKVHKMQAILELFKKLIMLSAYLCVRLRVHHVSRWIDLVAVPSGSLRNDRLDWAECRACDDAAGPAFDDRGVRGQL